MKLYVLVIAGMAVGSGIVSAQVAPPMQPGQGPNLIQGNPPIGIPGPITAQTPETVRTSVAIRPFRALKADASTNWIGEGIAQSITAQLSKSPNITISDLTSPATEQEQLVIAARAANIGVVVMGSFQVSGEEVRATGKVIASNGKVMGILSSRGTVKDVFALQDDLARQVSLAINPDRPATPPSPATGAANFVGGLGANPIFPDEKIVPRPFMGSLLEKAIKDEDTGKRGR